MATVNTPITSARRFCQTDSNGLTDTLGIEFANEALLDFRRRLLSNGVDASQLQEAYRDMTADTGTYLYPSDMFWLKAIELNYTSNVQQDYITATQVDISNLPNMTSFGWLRSNANANTPYFDDRGDWYEIFPTPVSGNSQGIRIFYFMEPTLYTATSDTIAYPESLDDRILAYRISADYYRMLNKFDEALAYDAQYEARVKDIIATLSRGSQQPIQAQTPPMTGWEF